MVGNRYNALKNQSRVAAQVDGARMGVDELRQKVDELGAERDQLNADSPGIPRRAFERARKGIEQGEAQYKVDQGELANGEDH